MTTDGLTKIKSSALHGYRYDPDKRDLVVKFTNGNTYTYADVPADKVEAMTGSASPGSYFNRRIAGVHIGLKVI
jgi:hypothetical protein